MIVQAVGLRLPENRINIQKVVLQQLLNRVRRGSMAHVGMVFHTPQIEDQSSRTKSALHPTECIRREDGSPQLVANVLH